MKKIYSMITMSLLATGAVAGQVVTYDASLPLARKSFRDRTAVARGMSTRASSTSSSLPENGWGYNCGIYNWNGYQNRSPTSRWPQASPGMCSRAYPERP